MTSHNFTPQDPSPTNIPAAAPPHPHIFNFFKIQTFQTFFTLHSGKNLISSERTRRAPKRAPPRGSRNTCIMEPMTLGSPVHSPVSAPSFAGHATHAQPPTTPHHSVSFAASAASPMTATTFPVSGGSYLNQHQPAGATGHGFLPSYLMGDVSFSQQVCLLFRIGWRGIHSETIVFAWTWRWRPLKHKEV